ncbi:hypothetical protein P3P1_02 [Pseudomonas aeruginosa]|nr:hypothetical protein P3P1_02 [Pseudomonas aeruginosa]
MGWCSAFTIISCAFTVHLNVHHLYLPQSDNLSSLSLLPDTFRVPISTWVVSDVSLHLR